MEASELRIRTLLVSATAVLLAEWATRFLLLKAPLDPMLVLGASRSVQIALMVWIISGYEGGMWAMGLARERMASGFVKGLVWSMGFGIMALIASVALLIFGIDPSGLIRSHLPSEPIAIALLVLVGCMLSPVAEEMFFRGLLYGFFRRWGVLLSLVLSTGAFVLAHPTTHAVPLTQLVGGVIFALAYEVEGTLVTPMVIHILGNMAIYALSSVL